jgi:CheY-like chemotaxis protein
MLDKDSKILVVDDSKVIRLSMRNFLKEVGYNNVILGEDGVQALSLYNDEKPDLLILDVVMPNLTGDEALEKLREKDKNTPVIMLTSVADGKVMDKCKELGICSYIMKPLTKVTGPKILGDALDKI